MNAPDHPVTPPPAERAAGLKRIRAELASAQNVVMTTHVHADGDGAGSEGAMGGWLRRSGREVTVVNPTPLPTGYRFLLDGIPAWTHADEQGKEAIREADLVLVLDTAEPSRLGQIMPLIESHRVLTIDHHPPVAQSLGEPSVRDATAAAVGELIYDLILGAGDMPTLAEARALYAAIVTDTGSFRYGNTTSRVHLIAAHLVSLGVDPEDMYHRLYGGYTRARLSLLQRALAGISTHERLPVAWISLSAADMTETGATRDDVEGIIEYARRLAGIEVAVLLRELSDGRTKVSLRTSGDTDVAAAARTLGGGGHVKAAGAVLDARLAEAQAQVIEALEEYF
ncbi:MAG: bifunctional oligoribonuclease/PAP phosphatase NrnA [Gemmatimonadota bacterium]|nr:bifunctional oligoribonuclease/PAP phosphatase NrnA [Gemmatimonadota bacterium]